MLLRYDIKPEEKSIIWKSRNEPEWHLYLVEEKEIYVSELTKPSEFDTVKKIDPYQVFPRLPTITAEETSEIKAYYKTEENRFLWEHHQEETLKHKKDWDKGPWFWKLVTKRPDSQWIKNRIEAIPVKNIIFKEVKYIATVEECESSGNDLYLSEFYEKVAGLPELIFWTVYWELSDHEKQILKELDKTSEKTGLSIYALGLPMRKKFFVFGQPSLDFDDGGEYNKRKKQIAGIFPRLPKITYTKRAVYKTYKMTIEK